MRNPELTHSPGCRNLHRRYRQGRQVKALQPVPIALLSMYTAVGLRMNQSFSQSSMHDSACSEKRDHGREIWSLSLLYLAGGIGFVLWAKSGAGDWLGAAVACVFLVLVGSMSMKLTFVDRAHPRSHRYNGDSAADDAAGLDGQFDVESVRQVNISTDFADDSLVSDKAQLNRLASELSSLEDQLLTETNGYDVKSVWEPSSSKGDRYGDD